MGGVQTLDGYSFTNYVVFRSSNGTSPEASSDYSPRQGDFSLEQLSSQSLLVVPLTDEARLLDVEEVKVLNFMGETIAVELFQFLDNNRETLQGLSSGDLTTKSFIFQSHTVEKERDFGAYRAHVYRLEDEGHRLMLAIEDISNRRNIIHGILESVVGRAFSNLPYRIELALGESEKLISTRITEEIVSLDVCREVTIHSHESSEEITKKLNSTQASGPVLLKIKIGDTEQVLNIFGPENMLHRVSIVDLKRSLLLIGSMLLNPADTQIVNERLTGNYVIKEILVELLAEELGSQQPNVVFALLANGEEKYYSHNQSDYIEWLWIPEISEKLVNKLTESNKQYVSEVRKYLLVHAFQLDYESHEYLVLVQDLREVNEQHQILFNGLNSILESEDVVGVSLVGESGIEYVSINNNNNANSLHTRRYNLWNRGGLALVVTTRSKKDTASLERAVYGNIPLKNPQDFTYLFALESIASHLRLNNAPE